MPSRRHSCPGITAWQGAASAALKLLFAVQVLCAELLVDTYAVALALLLHAPLIKDRARMLTSDNDQSCRPRTRAITLSRLQQRTRTRSTRRATLDNKTADAQQPRPLRACRFSPPLLPARVGVVVGPDARARRSASRPPPPPPPPEVASERTLLGLPFFPSHLHARQVLAVLVAEDVARGI